MLPKTLIRIMFLRCHLKIQLNGIGLHRLSRNSRFYIETEAKNEALFKCVFSFIRCKISRINLYIINCAIKKILLKINAKKQEIFFLTRIKL